MTTARARIRTFMDSDIAEIVELSLLAWEPAFESMEKVLGPRIFRLIWPDWRKTQAEGVEGACRTTDKYYTLVAECDGRAVGFIAYELKGETGEAWQGFIGRVKSGDIAKERTTPVDQKVVETLANAPTKCSVCGATFTQTILRGQTEITCAYCGSKTRL